ncbi:MULTISPECIES: NAD-dependent succinate-semialdehyde dehydrogenase [Paenarthrobacter]|jgi:succinate-semialdehyde dehydrogenase/glutarate-semialdehyde dehydrogenase|uniref:NAD-dependent succinate-semialdehyde dehydrogenase n=1 Tax=Paenarthrobacter TaxID=1742992 RepID=UPI000A65B624|nr:MULTISPECIES: NAD-dependent succinate-semialdehyde dehydrogenase [Paenarthrobacter]MDP9933843.1 succinate-semialdehyde dehydrogenase/glutarate-semialdehyde dehydrogenase [Paenarthrobacter nicotinovorans]
MIATINPVTGETTATFPAHTTEQVDAVLTAAVSAQKQWRLVPVEDRVQVLRNTAKVLRERKADYARLITLEMGKPVSEAEAEIEKCALTAEYYAETAPAHLAPEQIASSAASSGVVFDPLGVVLAIMPWNYPFWQFFRFVLPAVAAGNGAILKHANNVPQAALAVQDIMEQAGLPERLFATVLIESSEVAALIADDRIAAVTLTGSTQVGSIVASQAGAALKKQVLELGGSDPFIVLADADVRAAAKTAVKARFTNNGQSCVNAKRFIVDEKIADEFVAEFTANTKALVVGDPTDPATTIGPMARENLRTELHDQVTRTLAGGGQLVLGGNVVDGPGYYYEPTIIDHVKPGQAAFDEETFGPVAAIIRVSSTEEAITLANQSEYGLGAALWTQDTAAAAAELLPKIDAGAVFINGMVASDPRLPFGGIKKSGYGRELGSYGIREFTNMKTFWTGPATN